MNQRLSTLPRSATGNLVVCAIHRAVGYRTNLSQLGTGPVGVLAVQRVDGRPPWAFPGGTIEPGESPADAAVREVREETGCPIRPGRILGSRTDPATGQAITYVAAVPDQRTEVSTTGPGEVTEARWLTIREAVSLMPDMYQPVLAWLEATEEA